MSLSTIIHAGLTRPDRPINALVLMGGGARTAYQVGVLKALASMLRLQPNQATAFPFQVLVGTSAGALNAAYLAGSASAGLQAFDQLASFWTRLRSKNVYELNVSRWVRFSRLVAAVTLWGNARRQGAILNNMPLVDTLHQAVSLGGIEQALQDKAIDAVAVSASSYSSGVHWTFCHTARDSRMEPSPKYSRRPSTHRGVAGNRNGMALDAIRCSMVRGWNSARRPGRFQGSMRLSRAVWQNVQCTPLL